MKSRVRLNIKSEIKVALALVSVLALVAFTQRQHRGLVCKNMLIQIDNAYNNYFIDEGDIKHMLESAGQSIIGTETNQIDLRALEAKLKTNRHIDVAELFYDLKGNLIVNVDLRRPLARIVRPDAPDAYIAEDGSVMPTSEKFTPRVMLLSGSYFDGHDVASTGLDEELMQMIRFIDEHKFWRSQIAQLDIDHMGKITLYPQVTGQLVEFGEAANYETKFRKLMIFYKEILPQRGWTKYDRVNVEYEGQVIAE